MVNGVKLQYSDEHECWSLSADGPAVDPLLTPVDISLKGPVSVHVHGQQHFMTDACELMYWT